MSAVRIPRVSKYYQYLSSRVNSREDVERVYGLGILGDALNRTRREIRELTGQNMVPVPVTDDGEAIRGWKEIVAWARGRLALTQATTDRP